MFRWIAFVAVIATLGISGSYRYRARRTGEVIERRREGARFMLLRAAIALPLFVSVFTYLLHPRAMTWAMLWLPSWARWVGAALGVLAIPGALWVFSSLGRNVSETVLTKTDQVLITTGPYRWVRHPLYSTGGMLFVGVGLMAANWFILLFAVLAVVLLRAVAVPREEHELVTRFGADYRAYMQRTGRLLPRFSGGRIMKTLVSGFLVAAGLALGPAIIIGQSGDTAEAHIAAASAAAGQEHVALFKRACGELSSSAQSGPTTAPQPQGSPDRSQWHAEPVKVFDNLYFVGQTEYSAWAVTTSAGIILVDTIYDYSVEDEVVGGLRKLGLDPATIKYAIVSHGHSDHSGGAKYIQDHFGTRVILSAADWDLLDRGTQTRPKRDMVATDGQKLTLGDTTLTLYLTPGHTLGTISTLIPVKDHGTPHLAAEWGGTAFNWLRGRAAYITPERPDRFWFDTYSNSARRFRDIVARAGADVVIANHTDFDGSKTKLPALAKRKAGDPHPYVIGKDSVQRYLTVADECARAGRLLFK